MDEKIPKHIAIIPDGNRRWARRKGLSLLKGVAKSAGFENIKGLLDSAQDLGVKHITFWGFSTENWRRSEKERKFIFDLVSKVSDELRQYAKKNGVRFRHIGRKDRLPEKLLLALDDFEKETVGNDRLFLQFCLDYGGRDDVVRGIQRMVQEGRKDMDEDEFLKLLDTRGIPDPDLIIRTGGEKRLSGFLLYQAAYAELYFTDMLFPDFGPDELKAAVEDFSKRKRTFGGD